MTNDINVRECGKLLFKNAQKISQYFLILKCFDRDMSVEKEEE